IRGSIGYVEYAYAKQNKMTFAMLKNRDGEFVAPGDKTFQAAAAGADWKHAKGFYEILTDEPGKASWPITGATFILMRKTQADGAKAKEVLRFFDWAYRNGDRMALELDYIPMPDAVVTPSRGGGRGDTGGGGGTPPGPRASAPPRGGG